MYAPNTLFFCEWAKTGDENPIATQHRVLLLALIIERDTGLIVDAEVNSVCSITSDFIRDLMVGKRIDTDLNQIRRELDERYFGNSRKSLAHAVGAVAKRYLEVTGQRGAQ